MRPARSFAPLRSHLLCEVTPRAGVAICIVKPHPIGLGQRKGVSTCSRVLYFFPGIPTCLPFERTRCVLFPSVSNGSLPVVGSVGGSVVPTLAGKIPFGWFRCWRDGFLVGGLCEFVFRCVYLCLLYLPRFLASRPGWFDRSHSLAHTHV